MNAANATALTQTRYGTAHPEWVENALWEEAIREEWTGYALCQHLGIEVTGRFRQDFSHSAYRDTTPGPYWSWQRFGRTSTALPDGRVIHIAGEHEDSYDPDFCIYNDVVVEYPGGRREFYLYPKDVFPPTDFHSATLVGSEIILIGSLGYHDLRRIGETQVLKLDTRTLRIEPVATTGAPPGWISRHIAELVGETAILVAGGKVDTGRRLRAEYRCLPTRSRDNDVAAPRARRYERVSHFGGGLPHVQVSALWHSQSRAQRQPVLA